MKYLYLLILVACVHMVQAQTYDPFDGRREQFRANLQRYFESAEAEQHARRSLMHHISLFVKDSTWTSGNLPVKLDRYQLLLTRLERHEKYFRLLGYRNNKDTSARRQRGLINDQIDQIDGFVTRSLTKSRLPVNAKYRYLIAGIRAAAAHDLSPHDQALADKLSGKASDRLVDRYDDLMDKVTVTDLVTSDGKKLNPITGKGLLLRDKDPAVRKSAAIAFNGAYSQHGDLLAATLIDIAAEKTAMARLCGFKSAPERTYARRLQLSEVGVSELLEQMTRQADVLKAFQQLQIAQVKKVTGSASVHSYDLAIANTYQWKPSSYSETQQLIRNALVPLGNTYAKEFTWLLDPANGALDIAAGPNRVTENTSVGFPGVPVTLYMKNYNGSLSDVLRFAHEGGHAIHIKMMDGLSVPSYSSGPNFLFEAFAMLNELLVLDELEKTAATKEAKAYYVQQFLNKLAHEIFTSAEEGAFEQQLYDGVAAGKIKMRADVDSLYADIMDRYDVFFPNEPERKSEWINKRLLFDDPLYNVNYLYAMLVTCKLYDQLHRNPALFSQQYEQLLKNGFDADAEHLMFKFMGFKLDHQELLKSALELMKSKTAAFEKLVQ